MGKLTGEIKMNMLELFRPMRGGKQREYRVAELRAREQIAFNKYHQAVQDERRLRGEWSNIRAQLQEMRGDA